MVERKRLSPETTDVPTKKRGRVSPQVTSKVLPKIPNLDKVRDVKNLIHRGRPPGSRGKDMVVLSELIKYAAELNGSDGKGKDGLQGWLRTMCARYPKQFLSLMGKLLPLEVKVMQQPPPVRIFEFTDDMLARFSPEQRAQLETLLGGAAGVMPAAPTFDADPSEFERIIGSTVNGKGASH